MPYVKRQGIPQCRKPGVYLITNKTTGRVYVGLASCIRGRLMAHRKYLRIGKHDNSYLQRSWSKYGETVFRFDVLEVCDVSVLVGREQFYMDSMKVTDRRYRYNLAPTAGSNRGYKWSEESRQRNSEAQKALARDLTYLTEAAARVTRGKSRPTEVCKKIGDSQRGKAKGHGEAVKATHWSKRPDASEIIERSAMKHRGKKHSPDHRAKISVGGYRRWARVRAGIIHGTTSRRIFSVA